jgi:hypothetical protein
LFAGLGRAALTPYNFRENGQNLRPRERTISGRAAGAISGLPAQQIKDIRDPPDGGVPETLGLRFFDRRMFPRT